MTAMGLLLLPLVFEEVKKIMKGEKEKRVCIYKSG